MNCLVPQPQTSPFEKGEGWFKVEATYLRDCRAFDSFSGALFHFLELKTFARLIEMIGADTTGKIIAEKTE